MSNDDIKDFIKKGLICIALAFGIVTLCILGSLLSAWIVNNF